MPRYLCMQRILSGGGTGGAEPSAAQMKEMRARFGAWQEKFQKNLVDLGGKLGDGMLVTAGTASSEPVVELTELAGGYMIVSAEGLEEAVEVARACPGLVGPGSGVEVIEIQTP